MPIEIRSWGKQYHQGIRYAPDYGCPKCGWPHPMFPGGFEKVLAHIVGYTDASTAKQQCGGIVVECPKCFTKFWFHLKESLPLHEEIESHCEKWPRQK